MLHLLPALRELGHEVAFAGVHNRRAKGKKAEVEQWLQGFRDLGIPVFYRECISYLDPTIPIWLWRKYKTGASDGSGFDILHTHLIYADFWAACIRALIGKNFKAVSTVHGYEERILERFVLEPEKVPHNLYWQVFDATRRFLPMTYFCSNGLRSFYQGTGIRGSDQWLVVEHGFDFPSELPELDPSCKLGSPQIAVVGRLINRKGVALALEAIQTLIKEFPTLKLVIVGSGPEEFRLKALAETLGLSNHVHFEGFDPNPQRWMRASDVVLVPSYAEGLPLVIFEAFHSGTPVVAFDTIGCNDMIQDGETGLLAKPFEPKELADKLRKLILDNDLRQLITTKAKTVLEEQYSLSRMAKETVEVYVKTLALGAKAPR
jgi:L-malate glycosyltransferase